MDSKFPCMWLCMSQHILRHILSHTFRHMHSHSQHYIVFDSSDNKSPDIPPYISPSNCHRRNYNYYHNCLRKFPHKNRNP